MGVGDQEATLGLGWGSRGQDWGSEESGGQMGVEGEWVARWGRGRCGAGGQMVVEQMGEGGGQIGGGGNQ